MNLENEFEVLYKKIEFKVEYLKELNEKMKMNTYKASKDGMKCAVYIFLMILTMFYPILKIIRVILLILGLVYLKFCLDSILKNFEIQEEYMNIYENNIINFLIKSINEKYNYYPSKKRKDQYLKKHYFDAGFDDNIYTTYKEEEFIQGYIDENTYLTMADIKINENRARRKDELFYGLFAYIKTNRDIKDTIKICKNKKFPNFCGTNKIEMDSMEFEQCFDVYCENKIKAMQLITSDIMECFLNFYKKFSIDYEVIFKKDSIYMRFFSDDMFTGNIDKKVLFYYYRTVKLITEFSTEANKIINEATF